MHHGNGTQDIFLEDPSVLLIDLHQEGVWPETGSLQETGAGGPPCHLCLIVLTGLLQDRLRRATRLLSAGDNGIAPHCFGCAGKGVGSTLNIPLPWHSGHASVQRVFQEVVLPAARRFGPDIILISAGLSLLAARVCLHTCRAAGCCRCWPTWLCPFGCAYTAP